MIKIKRIYDEPATDDGYRVLVDRLWPRGVSRERAALDEWFKDIAPSPELRQWFGHEPERFEEFSARYMAELDDNPAAVAQLRSQEKVHGTVSLLYAAHDPVVNHAAVLREYLSQPS